MLAIRHPNFEMDHFPAGGSCRRNANLDWVRPVDRIWPANTPTELTAQAVSNSQINLTWRDNAKTLNNTQPVLPQVTITPATRSVMENIGTFDTTVTLSSPRPVETLVILRPVETDTALMFADYYWTPSNLEDDIYAVATIPAGQTSATFSTTIVDNTLTEGNKVFTWRIQPSEFVYTIGNPSASVVTVVDDEGTPTGDFFLTSTAVSGDGTAIDLSWNAVPGATAYRISISYDGGETYNQSTEIDATATTAKVIDLPEDTVVTHRVEALSLIGAVSATSQPSTRTTTTAPAGPPTTQPTTGPVTGTPQNPTPLLVSWYGVTTDGTLSQGDVRIESIGDFVGGTVSRDLDGDGIGDALPYNAGKQGMLDLFHKIDGANGGVVDKILTASEIASVRVSFLGYSWGSFTAVNESRRLSSPRTYLGYTLQSKIQIEQVITLDPVHGWIFPTPFTPVRTSTLRWVHGNGCLNNVNVFRNFYQRRGGSFGLKYGPSVTNTTTRGTHVFGGGFSVALKGNKLPSVAPDLQININDSFGQVDRVRELSLRFFDSNYDPLQTNYAKMKGSDAEHLGLPWYMAPRVVELLLPGFVASPFAPPDSFQQITNN